MPTESDLRRLCPIDGELGSKHTPGVLTTAQLRDAAGSLEKQLRAGRNRSWAKLFTDALALPDDEFAVVMGHGLAVLLRRGPVREVDFSKDDLEQLLVDTVVRWPPRSPT